MLLAMRVPKSISLSIREEDTFNASCWLCSGEIMEVFLLRGICIILVILYYFHIYYSLSILKRNMIRKILKVDLKKQLVIWILTIDYTQNNLVCKAKVLWMGSLRLSGDFTCLFLICSFWVIMCQVLHMTWVFDLFNCSFWPYQFEGYEQ